MAPSARLAVLSLLALSAGVLTAACGDDNGMIPLPEYDGSTGAGVDSGSDSGDDASQAGDAGDAAMGADADAGTGADGDAGVKPGDGGSDSSTGMDAGNDAAQPSACDGGAPVTHDVSVGPGMAFVPAALTICAGDTVRWTWGSGGHTVTSGTACIPDNKFCSPNDMNCVAGTTSPANSVYSHTFATPGTYPYFCVPHCLSGMTGTITVQ